MSERGWFSYSRSPDGRFGEWTLTRTPDDPPILIWEAGDGTSVIDDQTGDRYVQLFGFTAEEIRSAVTFAQAMGWLEAGTGVAFKQLPGDGHPAGRTPIR
jgi:hypothetical protein